MGAMQPAQQPMTYGAIRPRIAQALAHGAFRQTLAVLTDLRPKLPPDDALAEDMATCLWQLGDPAAAMALTGEILGRDPGNAETWGRLGAMAFSAGEMVLAEQALEAALEIRPGFAAALVSLNRIRGFARDSHRARRLRALAGSGPGWQDRAHAHHGLGLIEARTGNPRGAMHHFGRAKQLMPGRYDPQAVTASVAAQRQGFLPQQDGGTTAATPRMVFVVGMPRSGTTLVESILLRHPDVASVGESHAVQDCLEHWRRTCAQAHGPGDDWSWLARPDPDGMAQIRDRYLTIVSARMMRQDAPVLVDKTPLNVLALGFLRAVFPGARFIAMSRHPLDLGLSNFGTNFTAGFTRAQPWTKRLDSIGHFTRCVHDSIADYRAKLGAVLRVQSYAALVGRPETQIRAMLAHLELDWTPACLTPEAREGIVRTASAAQVRAPINAEGLGKWRAYQAELAPLIQALGGWDWIRDWETADLAAGA